MKVVNLTPHALSISTADGSTVAIQPSGDVARVSIKSEIVARLDGINVVRQTFGPVEGLPAPQPGVVFIVSRMVKDRAAGRDDVLVPGAPVRDTEGRIIGANGLSL